MSKLLIKFDNKFFTNKREKNQVFTFNDSINLYFYEINKLINDNYKSNIDFTDEDRFEASRKGSYSFFGNGTSIDELREYLLEQGIKNTKEQNQAIALLLQSRSRLHYVCASSLSAMLVELLSLPLGECFKKEDVTLFEYNPFNNTKHVSYTCDFRSNNSEKVFASAHVDIKIVGKQPFFNCTIVLDKAQPEYKIIAGNIQNSGLPMNSPEWKRSQSFKLDDLYKQNKKQEEPVKLGIFRRIWNWFSNLITNKGFLKKDADETIIFKLGKSTPVLDSRAQRLIDKISAKLPHNNNNSLPKAMYIRPLDIPVKKEPERNKSDKILRK